MTLAYVTSVTPTSPQGACTNSNNNTVLVINSATLVIYDLPTLTQQHSYAIQNATPSGVSIINSSSAIVCYEGVNTVDLVELSGGFRQSYSGGTSTLIGAQLKGQNIAADPSTNVAFWGSTASNSINRFDGNAFSVSAITLPFHGGSAASFTIMLKSPGRWFVAGNSYSDILEIDSLGNVVDSFSFPLQVFPSTNYDATGATQQVSPPNAISYSNNMLTVSFNNAAFCQMDWSTKTILKIHHPGVGYCLATCASGVTITHPTTLGLQGHLMELDMAIRPMTVRDQLFLDSTAVSIGCDINPATGYGWALSQSSKLYSFTVAPRASTTRTFTVQNNGINQVARLVLLDDTGGQGTDTVLLDTKMQSPATYTVPTGKTIIEIVRIGEGTNSLWDVSTYST